MGGVRFWLHGVQINIIPDNEYVTDIDLNQINIDDYEPEIHLGRQLLQKAKDMHPDAEIITANHAEPRIRVTSQFGKDEIHIISKVGEKGAKKGEAVERLRGKQWVLLVEMGDGPGAVAIFAPDGEGHSGGAGGAGGANLKYVGYANQFEPSSRDPLGLIGQTTYRQKWVNLAYDNPEAGLVILDVPHVQLEQEYRIDQGVYAYEGDEEDEEVTALYYMNNIWCWEGIEYTYHWKNVTPGPPPPEFCGYTWSIEPTYGGDDSGEYHDVIHLFYQVEVTGTPPEPGKVIAWWPPEFNQFIEKYQYWNEECAAFPAKYYENDEWWTADQVGLPAGVGHLCPLYQGEPLAFGVAIVYDDTERVFGNIWGWSDGHSTGWTAYDHNYADHPYTAEVWKDPWRSSQPLYDPATWFADGSGVYYAPDWREVYIMGASIYQSAADWSTSRGVVIYEREEVDPYVRFHADSIGDLTERMLELMKGNEDMYDYIYSPFTGMSDYAAGTEPSPPRMMSIFAGQEYYEIKLEQEAGNYIYARWLYNRRTHPYFWDFGIFTKDGEGIEVDATGKAHITGDVEPIYAYCMEEIWPLQAQQENNRVIYGMVLDGAHYRTEEYEKIDNTNVLIPEAQGATDSNNSPVTAKLKVRVGIRRPFIVNKLQ